jgi:L-ascorbate metabolism protein UlaG (beta-lactamase superfamily)
MFEYNNITIKWLGHDSFLISAKGKNIYIDPFKIEELHLPKADIIITTHEHFDHLNVDSITHLSSSETLLIGPDICQDQLKNEISLKKEVYTLNPGDKIDIDDLSFSAIHAYNIHRFRSPGEPFHPKKSGHIGPIIHIDDVTIYHAGDTDKIPEMDGLEPDIALLPVSGTYVMDVDECIEAALAVNAKITIPMHVGRGIGELEFASELKSRLPNLRVEVLKMEG